jgi:F420-dependent oxidoreductase-like protein
MEIEFGVRLSLVPEYFEKHDFTVIMKYARKCEELGFSSAWVMDQLLWGEKGPFECWVTLSALASATKRIRLGPFVNCTSYRNPALLGKMAATLDKISNGRLEFGIGAGWNKKEYNAYGIPFFDNRTRIEQMREAIILIKKMWTEERPSYSGKYFRISEAICEPKPVQKPHPPILIGGGGEKLTLRVVAELADKCNFLEGTLQNYRHKLKILGKLCKEVGRDFSDITKTWHGDIILVEEKSDLISKIEKFKPRGLSLDRYFNQCIAGTPEACVTRLKQYVDLGVTYFIPSLRTIREDLPVFSECVLRALK